jgi:mono/diheme cytochrome c family protein
MIVIWVLLPHYGTPALDASKPVRGTEFYRMHAIWSRLFVGMLRRTLAVGLWLAASCAASTDPSYRQVIDKYCVTCHNQRLKTGGLTLDTLDISKVPAQAEVWEKVIRKLRAGTMPPAGMPRPDAAAYKELTVWLEKQIDQSAEPYAGRPILHRLNRTEYANAVRDLLSLDIDAAALLPPDDAAFGFDNVSDALGVSPALQEHYLDAALKIGALAVGDPNIAPGSETWRIRQDLSQDKHVNGLPLGTLGGTKVRYNFPLDGEYSFQANLYRTNLNIMRGLESPHQVEFSLDGRRIHLASIGGQEDLASLFEKPTDTGDAVDARLRVRIPVTAGPHEVVVAFLDDPDAVEPMRLQPYIRSSVDNFDWSGSPHLQALTVAGPFHPAGASDTPSRRRIFVCHPNTRLNDDTCARQILSTLAGRAYRQPLAGSDLDTLMQFYRSGKQDGGFEGGIQLALERILASPKFLFRVERDPAGAVAAGSYRITDTELASRLSFFLWSSIPDDELLSLASEGKLQNPAVFDRQVRRMLADPKSQALVDNFAGQWLQLRNLRNVQPNTDLFPDFDDNLRQSFRRETELFFESVVQEDRSVLDLLSANYTFVNERLARHYGIPDIYGTRFRRVAVTDDARRGLLGQGSILALTSHAERTSPVVRGKWILENILGTPVPPPPPDVPPLKGNQEGEKPRTMREQMAEHRANPVCASCHKAMDSIGFAMENFDAVGAWRTHEPGGPIDASGELSDGTKVNGVVTLRNALLSRPEMFAGTLTEKLMIYALGRGLDYRDMPTVRAILQDASRSNYRFSTLVLGIVHSAPFQMRTAAGDGEGPTIRTAQNREGK